MNIRRLLAGLLAMGAFAAAAQTAQEVVDIPSRPGVTERALVLRPAAAPTSTVILLTGGSGRVGIYNNGSLQNGGNFLVRTREQFQQLGHAVLVLDTPSDHASQPFLNGEFRASPEHAADLAAAIAWARQQFGAPVWVIGTSRGTHSAALAATALMPPQAPDGVVLTSSILVRSPPRAPTHLPGVQELDWSRAQMPVLVVHHAQDACQATPPSQLPQLMGKLAPARSALLTYEGGKTDGDPCEPWHHHGFNGIDQKVVADISAWIGSRK